MGHVPGVMRAAVRRPRGAGSRQGGLSSGDAPPISLLSCQKRNGPCTVQREKRLGALRCGGPPCARGSAYRCLLRFRLAFGHAIIFCKLDTTVPWRMVPTSSGWLSHRAASLFAAAGCSSWERERQRGERLRVSQTSPGQRSPQGRRVSGPDFYKGAPAIPLPAAGGLRLRGPTRRSVFSLWTVHGPFLFWQDQKRNGGCICPAISMAVFSIRTGGTIPGGPMPVELFRKEDVDHDQTGRTGL